MPTNPTLPGLATELLQQIINDMSITELASFRRINRRCESVSLSTLHRRLTSIAHNNVFFMLNDDRSLARIEAMTGSGLRQHITAIHLFNRCFKHQTGFHNTAVGMHLEQTRSPAQRLPHLLATFPSLQNIWFWVETPIRVRIRLQDMITHGAVGRSLMRRWLGLDVQFEDEEDSLADLLVQEVWLPWARQLKMDFATHIGGNSGQS